MILAILSVILAAAHAPAQAADKDTGSGLLTVQDVAQTKYVTAAAISPDGKKVAYLLSVQRNLSEDDNGPAWSELHVVDQNGVSRPFVTGEINVSSVKWTPDGHGISFVAKRGKDKHSALYVIPVDGGEARKLLAPESGIGKYAWSADGKHIAFLAKEKEDKQEKRQKKKGFDAEVYEENDKPVRVWIADADFDADDEPRMLELPGSANDVQWSPDGTKLAVSLAPTPHIDDTYMFTRIHLADASSGEVILKLDNPGKLGDVRFSPDGKRLAFLSGEDIHDPSDGRLMVASLDSGAFGEVIKDYRPNVVGIEWQDDMTIMFLAADGCYSAFGEVRYDGAERKIHIPTGGPVLSSFTLSDDGMAAAFVGSAPTHPNEVFISSHEHPAPQRLTDSNPWLAEKRLAKQEVIRFKARDGETVEGILIHPLDEQPHTRYPLILTVHGGPESRLPDAWLTRYSYPGQVAAAQGIAVFYPNYRGSTGRGVAYAKAHQADYAGKEFNDLIDGIDYLIEIGLVDGDKVGVTGGSYGGYATAWCCTYYSKRFAAGVMFVGISDLISKSGTTDIPEEMYLVHARKRFWEDWDFFLERSPLRYIEQAQTPLLILHGKSDTRVHPSQSLELYRNLKVLGKAPVRLVLYPGEGHGNRKAAGRLDYNLRMMRWMNHYLKGPGGEIPPYEIDHGIKTGGEKEDDADEPDADPTEE